MAFLLIVPFVGCHQKSEVQSDQASRGADRGSELLFQTEIRPAWIAMARRINSAEGEYVKKTILNGSNVEQRVRYACLDDGHRKVEELSPDGSILRVGVMTDRYEFTAEAEDDNSVFVTPGIRDKLDNRFEQSPRYIHRQVLNDRIHPIYASISAGRFKLDGLSQLPNKVSRQNEHEVRLEFSIPLKSPSGAESGLTEVSAIVDERLGWAVTRWNIALGPLISSGESLYDPGWEIPIPKVVESTELAPKGAAANKQRFEFSPPLLSQRSRHEFQPQHYGLKVYRPAKLSRVMRVSATILVTSVVLLACVLWLRFRSVR